MLKALIKGKLESQYYFLHRIRLNCHHCLFKASITLNATQKDLGLSLKYTYTKLQFALNSLSSLFRKAAIKPAEKKKSDLKRGFIHHTLIPNPFHECKSARDAQL